MMRWLKLRPYRVRWWLKGVKRDHGHIWFFVAGWLSLVSAAFALSVVLGLTACGIGFFVMEWRVTRD